MHLRRNHVLIGVLLTFSSVQLVAGDRLSLRFQWPKATDASQKEAVADVSSMSPT